MGKGVKKEEQNYEVQTTETTQQSSPQSSLQSSLQARVTAGQFFLVCILPSAYPNPWGAFDKQQTSPRLTEAFLSNIMSAGGGCVLDGAWHAVICRWDARSIVYPECI